MVELSFVSTFSPRFEVLRCLERDRMKKKCAKCRAGTCFILYVQKAGVVFQAIRNIESVHVSLDKDGIMRVTLDK